MNIADPLTCLAVAIYFEARNEPEIGQAAVAHVILNRVESTAFPDDPCSVVKEHRLPGTPYCQFSFWCDGKSDTPRRVNAYMDALIIAVAVVEGEIPDPTGGATHYHADYVFPKWRTAFRMTGKIGRHLFYRDS